MKTALFSSLNLNLNLVLALAALLLHQPARADATAPTKLTCSESGEAVFEAQFAGARYADRLSLRSFDGDLVKDLVSRSEQTLRFTGSSISAFVTVGKCVATPGRDTLLSCDATASPRGSDFILATYLFHHFRSLGTSGEFSESVSVDRPVKAERLKLTVSKRRVHDPLLGRDYTAAHVRLELAGQSSLGRFNLAEERTLGELVSEDRLTPWGTCAFVK
jgi:hypothetical protein